MAKHPRQLAARAKTGEKRRGAVPSQPSKVSPLSIHSGLQVGHLEEPRGRERSSYRSDSELLAKSVKGPRERLLLF